MHMPSSLPALPRPFTEPDFNWAHQLNITHEVELSPLDLSGFTSLVNGAAFAKVVDPQAGFLICIGQEADYDSPNFLWHRDRLTSFIYVDRIAIDESQRGRGHAKQLYEALFEFALTKGIETIACEVNSDPPNPASDAFHKALGFEAIGEARLAARGKTVRYLAKAL